MTSDSSPSHPVGIRAIISVLTLYNNILTSWKLFSRSEFILSPTSLPMTLLHLLLSAPPFASVQTFQYRDLFAYARWVTAVSKSEGSLVAPAACLSSVYLWRNQCWMLMGEICGLWLFPSHAPNTHTNSGVRARSVGERGIDLKRILLQWLPRS